VQTIDRSPAAAPAKPHHRLLWAALTGVSLLIAGWSTPGFAAAHLAGSCDKMGRNLQSPDIGPAAIELVDLSDVSGSDEAPDNLTKSVAPLLFLTPRVASILQDVFGDGDDEIEAGAADQELDKEMVEVEPEKAGIDHATPASPPVVDNASGDPATVPAADVSHRHLNTGFRQLPQSRARARSTLTAPRQQSANPAAARGPSDSGPSRSPSNSPPGY
jgi:hypothetical protein